MRVILFALTVCFASAGFLEAPFQQEVALSKNDAIDFLVGFALGIINFAIKIKKGARFVEKVPDSLGCASVAGGVAASVKDAVALIKRGGVDNIVAGVQKLTAIFNNVSKQCGDTGNEANSYIQEIFTVVRDPQYKTNVAQAFYKYAEVAGRDIAEIVKGFRNSDHTTAGVYAGDIARIAIWFEPNPQLEEQLSLIEA